MTKNNTKTAVYHLIRSCFERIYRIEEKWVVLGQISDKEIQKQCYAYDKLKYLWDQLDEQKLNGERIIGSVYKFGFEKKFKMLYQKNLL